jgi:hypothetical protein
MTKVGIAEEADRDSDSKEWHLSRPPTARSQRLFDGVRKLPKAGHWRFTRRSEETTQFGFY